MKLCYEPIAARIRLIFPPQTCNLETQSAFLISFEQSRLPLVRWRGGVAFAGIMTAFGILLLNFPRLFLKISQYDFCAKRARRGPKVNRRNIVLISQGKSSSHDKGHDEGSSLQRPRKGSIGRQTDTENPEANGHSRQSDIFGVVWKVSLGDFHVW